MLAGRSSPRQHTPPRILIIDDDQSMRVMLRKIMAEEGYEVMEATNGQEGLQVFESYHPDLVLTDALMPVMDGLQYCARLRQKPYGVDVPLLIITSLDDEASIDRAFAVGATDYITKPVHWAVLRQRVRRLLQASRATQELRHQGECERLLRRIMLQVRQSLDLQQVLATAAKEVRSLLGVEQVAIARVNTNGYARFVVESTASGFPSILGAACPLGMDASDSPSGVIAIADVLSHSSSLEARSPAALLGLRARLVVPITSQAMTWGFLCAHQRSAPRLWEAFEIELLSQLADQIAIAIQQSELYQKVQWLNADLERQVQERTGQLEQALECEALLKRITDKVRDSLVEEQILESAVRELALGLNASGCNASRYDLEAEVSTICYEYTTTIPSSQGRVSQMNRFAEIYGQLRKGQDFQFCSIAPNPVRGRVAMLACPILDDQGVLGDLWLINPPDRPFSELEQRLVQQIANQCAIAIRQARLYQTAQTQVEELEQINQLKDDFLSTVSHELRTPMASMKMAIHMLAIALKECLPEMGHSTTSEALSKAHRYFEILNHECEREINLINDLLDLQRLEEGRQPVVLETIHLDRWLPPLLAPFHERTRSREQQFHLHIPDPAPLVVSNGLSLARVLTELLNNACKYTPAQEAIALSISFSEEAWHLRISNSGVEIPAPEIHRIFDKFYRIPKADPWKQGGTGLGLALVQKLVQHLGGTLTVRSSHGLTEFWIDLPRNPTPETGHPSALPATGN